MAEQYSTTTRNRFRDAYAAALPAGTVLQYRSGAPAGVGNAAGGTLISEMTLPVSPYTLGAGVLTKNGTWEDASADNAGTIGHYRKINGADIAEGTVTATGGGGDATVDNPVVAVGQKVITTTWTRTAYGA